MGTFTQVTHNVSFLKKLWRNKATVRALLNSENFIFVRDYLPGHFYSPIPDLRELNDNARKVFDRSVKRLEAVNLNESRQLQLANAFAEAYQEMPFPETRIAEFRYYLDNPFFSFGDGIVLYSFFRYFKPKRVVEVGSGFSSAEMLDMSTRFCSEPIEFTFIEPRPKRLYSLLSQKDKELCNIQTKPVQRVDPAFFRELQENDFLFIDSSHVGKIDSDVLHIIFNILPLLKPGVLVHFHDILWPFEYPQNWVEEGRAYNESYMLRAFLQYNSAFEIVYFNSYMAIHHTELIKCMMPLVLKSPSTGETEGNSSVWLRKIV